MGNPSILVYKNLQSQRNLDTNTDARAAQTAMKCSIPFLLLSDFLPSDLFLAAAGELPRADGCGARAARLPGPARPRARGCRSSTAACEQLPAPSPGFMLPCGTGWELGVPGTGLLQTHRVCLHAPRRAHRGNGTKTWGPIQESFPFSIRSQGKARAEYEQSRAQASPIDV